MLIFTLIEDNFFGTNGNFGHLLGNFIAVGTKTNKQFLPYKYTQKIKGYHCALTKEEMTVLLIILANK